MKIRKGDNVLIISGKDRGKHGKVLKVLSKENKILVEAVNLRKKHQKPKKSGEKGQIITKPAPIAASGVKVICSKCGKAARMGYKVGDELRSSPSFHGVKAKVEKKESSLTSPFANARVINVILGSPDRFGEMKKMINWLKVAYQW